MSKENVAIHHRGIICVLVLIFVLIVMFSFRNFIRKSLRNFIDHLSDVPESALQIVAISAESKTIRDGFDFQWEQKTVEDANGEIHETETGCDYNNQVSGLFHFDKITLNILDDLFIKIVYYDENGQFLYTDGWQSAAAVPSVSDGEVNQIVVEDANIRICIADPTRSEETRDALTAEELESRFRYQIETSAALQPSSVATIGLPDVAKGNAKNGFTCTGLTFDESENCFYAGNYGKELPSDSAQNMTIVKLSRDCKTNLGEIDLHKKIPALKDVQGITVDTSDNTLWLASPSNDAIYHITKEGKILNSYHYKNANGLAYDSRTDSLWVMNNSNVQGTVTICNLNKKGKLLWGMKMNNIFHSDQLYLDAAKNTLYFTAGANYDGGNYVYRVNLTEKSCSLAYVLPDSYSIEGLSVVDGLMYVCNDGHFHQAAIQKNIMKVYDLANVKVR